MVTVQINSTRQWLVFSHPCLPCPDLRINEQRAQRSVRGTTAESVIVRRRCGALNEVLHARMLQTFTAHVIRFGPVSWNSRPRRTSRGWIPTVTDSSVNNVVCRVRQYEQHDGFYTDVDKLLSGTRTLMEDCTV